VKLEMSVRDNIRSLFTTPLAHFVLPNSTQINPGLSKLLFEMEQRTGADQHPPLDGWQAGTSLEEAANANVSELMDTFHSAVFSLLSILTRTARYEARQHINTGASIYRPRTFCRPSLHGGHSWSGIYFVQAAKLGMERSGLAGQLSFHDPRNRLAMVSSPGMIYKGTFDVKPRDGLMVIYPSWLQCQLNPFESESAIALISFRSRISGFRPLD